MRSANDLAREPGAPRFAVQIAIVLLIVVISAISGKRTTRANYEVGASGPEAVALVNGLQSQTIRDVTVTTKEVDDEAAGRADVADGELDAAVIDGGSWSSARTLTTS